MSEMDVSKCEFYNKDDCTCYYLLMYGYEIQNYDSCKGHPNCYYKQLQRVKQENEKLKQDLKDEEDTTEAFISDVSIYFTYDEGKPNNFDELESCIEQTFEQMNQLKQENEELKARLNEQNTCN